MNTEITALEAARELLAHDNILIISHQNPDGDTLGAAFALCYALTSLRKHVRVACPDNLPKRFSYLYHDYKESDFLESYIVAVDVAALQLFGNLREAYGGKVDMCIDHHPSNELYAAKTYVRSDVAAACELIYEVIQSMGAEITPQIANCLYTGIATDTGCFKFSNTTENTHKVAAELFRLGADYRFINEYLFEIKSKQRIWIERQAINTMEFFSRDRIAIIHISQEMITSSAVDESELDGIPAIPRSVAGVMIGITLKEKQDGTQKISVRTTEKVNASKICAQFGGGGHARAAGCVIQADYQTAKKMLLEACEAILAE